MTSEAERDFLDLIKNGTMDPKRRCLFRAVWDDVVALRAALSKASKLEGEALAKVRQLEASHAQRMAELTDQRDQALYEENVWVSRTEHARHGRTEALAEVERLRAKLEPTACVDCGESVAVRPRRLCQMCAS